jgi:hypothetical protein
MVLFAQQPFTTELISKQIQNLPFNNSMIWKNNKGLTLRDAARIRDEYEFKWKEGARPSWMMQEGRKLLGIEPITTGATLNNVQMMAGEGHIEKRIEWVKNYVQRLMALNERK